MMVKKECKSCEYREHNPIDDLRNQNRELEYNIEKTKEMLCNVQAENRELRKRNKELENNDSHKTDYYPKMIYIPKGSRIEAFVISD